MNFSSYIEQVNGLANYSNVPQVPKDPYNISVSLTEELLGYDKNITLNSAEQSAYNQAVNMSTVHGPCCCRCWRWYAFEGQAKYFIIHDAFNSSQIARIWNLEDGCGGPADTPGYQPPA
jgi:hypothetical protein